MTLADKSLKAKERIKMNIVGASMMSPQSPGALMFNITISCKSIKSVGKYVLLGNMYAVNVTLVIHSLEVLGDYRFDFVCYFVMCARVQASASALRAFSRVV
ncbi:MAG: hypothetical protein U1E19_03170 [Rhodoblastus sp.]